jgi:hypothetical protein
MMPPPPTTIDGATVLRVAAIDPSAATGRTRHVVEGEVRQDFKALAIARYGSDSEVYLFYCDADWNAVTDTLHDDIEHAVSQAEFEYGPLEFLKIKDD